MAGIKGQPSGNPAQLKSPVPNTEEGPSFEDYVAGGGGTSPSFEDYAMGQGLPSEAVIADQEAPGIGAEVAQTAADWMPAAGGIAGGIVGIPFGPVGMAAGATLGAAGGTGWKQLIEQTLLGKEQEPNEQLKEVGKEALLSGVGEVAGIGVAKAAGATLSRIAQPASKFIDDVMRGERAKVLEPLTNLLAVKSAPLNTQAAGDQVKKLLTANIKGKYGPFIDAYSALDEVAQALPLADEARVQFTQKLKASIINKSKDEYKVVENFAHALDAADNGARFQAEIRRLNGTIRSLQRAGDTELAVTLRQARDQATEFFEGETTKLAARVRGGVATPREIAALDQMAAQKGVDPSNYYKRNRGSYADNLAKEYLGSLDKVKKEYRGFRNFLEDVGEQTKTRVGSKGPMAFLDNLDDVPSEKLVERMFDPKNARALSQMKTQSREVYDTVVKSKMTEMLEKNSLDGALNLKKFRNDVMKLPGSTRAHLFSKNELNMLNSVVDNPRLSRLESLQARGDGMIARWAKDVAEVGRIAGSRISDRSKGVMQTVGGQVPARGLGMLMGVGTEGDGDVQQ